MATITLHDYIRQIDKLLDANRINEAVTHCRHILSKFPRHVETYRLLAKASLERGDYSDAADLFQRVLSAEPNDFVSHIGLSVTFKEDDLLSQAIWHMERAYEMDPYNPTIQEELKKLYEMNDMEVPDKLPLTQGALARLYFRGGLYEEAAAELRQALSEDEDRIDLEALMAEVLWRDGKRVEAVSVCLSVLEKLPNCIKANAILAEIWLLTDRVNEAQTYLQTLRELVQPDASHLDIETAVGRAFNANGAPILPNVVEIEHFDEEYSGGEGEPAADWVTAISFAGGEEDADDSGMYDWLRDVPVEEEQISAGDSGLEGVITGPVDEASWFTDQSDHLEGEGGPGQTVTGWLRELDSMTDGSAGVKGADAAAPVDEEFHDSEFELTGSGEPEAAAEPENWLEAGALQSDTAAADDDTPDWLSELPDFEPVQLDPMTASQWMQEDEDEEEDEAIEPDEIGISPDEPVEEEADWLTLLEQEESGTPAQVDSESTEDLLADFSAGVEAAELLPATEADLPDWLQEAVPPAAEETAAMPEPWLEVDQTLLSEQPELELPEDAAEIEMTRLADETEPADTSSDWVESEEIPDWLRTDSLKDKAEQPPAEVPAELDLTMLAGEPELEESPEISEDVEEIPDWLRITGYEDEIAEEPAEEWAEPNLTLLADAPGQTAEETPSDGDAELPDWLQTGTLDDELEDALSRPEGTPAPDAADVGEPASASLETAAEETFFSGEEEIPDWLTGDAFTADDEIDQGEAAPLPDLSAQDAAARSAGVDEELEIPDWLLADANTPSEEAGEFPSAEVESAVASEAAGQLVDDGSTWPDAAAEQEEIDDDALDWLQASDFSEPEVLEESVGASQDLSEDEPEESASGTEATSDELDETLDWLEDLALRQTGPLNQLLTPEEIEAVQTAETYSTGDDLDWLEELAASAGSAPADEIARLELEDADAMAGEVAPIDLDDLLGGSAEQPTNDLSFLDQIAAGDGPALEEPPTQVPAGELGHDETPLDEAEQLEPGVVDELLDALATMPAEVDDLAAEAPEDDLDGLDWLDQMMGGESEALEEAPTVDWPEEEMAEPTEQTEPAQATAAVDSPVPELPEDPDDAMAWLEELAVRQGAPVEELITVTDTAAPEPEAAPGDEEAVESEPAVAEDLDDAMAWLEELAVSDDAPQEELPSVADVLGLDEAAVMDAAAAEEPDSEAPTQPELEVVEAGVDSAETEGVLESASEDLEEAMHWLEELAKQQGVPVETAQEPEPAAAVGEQPDDETSAPEAISEAASELDEALDLLEQLAADTVVPVSKGPEGNGVADGAVGDLDDALDWLEQLVTSLDAAAPAQTELPEFVTADAAVEAEVVPEQDEFSDLMGEMPDDPDAALAWLEGFTGDAVVPTEAAGMPLVDETPAEIEVEPVAEVAAEAAEEVTESETAVPETELPTGPDLVAEMPDDPEEALAWLTAFDAEADETADEEDESEDVATLVAEVIPPTILEPVEDTSLVEEEPEEKPAEVLAEEPLDTGFVDEIPDDPDEAMAWLEQLALSQGAAIDELTTVSPETAAETPSEEQTPFAGKPDVETAEAAAASEPETAEEHEEVEARDDEPDLGLDDDLDDAMPSWLRLRGGDEEEPGPTDWLKSLPEPDVTGWLETEEEVTLSGAYSRRDLKPRPDTKYETGPLPEIGTGPLPGRDTGPLPGRDTGPLPGRDTGPLRGGDTGSLLGRLAFDDTLIIPPAGSDEDTTEPDEEQLAQARERLASGDVDSALGAYQTLVEEGEGLNTLIADLETAALQYTNQPMVRRLLGDAYMRNGQLHKALETYRLALDQL